MRKVLFYNLSRKSLPVASFDIVKLSLLAAVGNDRDSENGVMVENWGWFTY